MLDHANTHHTVKLTAGSCQVTVIHQLNSQIVLKPFSLNGPRKLIILLVA